MATFYGKKWGSNILAVVSFSVVSCRVRPANLERDAQVRILVVDDHHASAESLAILLRLWGANVRVSRNGADAIDTALQYRPDAVLLDIMLPGIDGYRLARQFHEHPQLQHVMLIAVTGLGDQDHRTRARNAGFTHHLLKPLIHAQLQEILKALALKKTSPEKEI
jgi:CheY-like chemotaxis protein